MAIIGGFFALDADQQLGQEARSYAQELGRALAETGFGLVVYFSNDQSLEPHVVSGFVAALPPGESGPCIDVRYSEAQRGLVRFNEQSTHPSLFHEDTFPGQNWEAPFYRSLAARDSVDAALLMAGGQSTLNAGQVAVGRGLPLLAIDKYSGSAQVLRTELATRIAGYPAAQGSNPSQLVSWLHEQHRKEHYFEALSRGLCTRCLRFALPVASTRRKTRFRPVANRCRVGFDPQGSIAFFHVRLRRSS